MAVQARCPGYGPGDGYERHLFTANGELRSTVCLRCGARGQVMNEATIGVWGWNREKETKDVVIYGPSYPENNDTCDIVLADGVYLSEEDAATIVRDHNAHGALVEALGKIRDCWPDDEERMIWTHEDWRALASNTRALAAAALEEVK